LEAGRLLPENNFSRKKSGKEVKYVQLLTKEITTRLPFLYTQEDEKDPIVICKFFAVWTNWTWYARRG